MFTVRAWIEMVKLFLEDATVRPQSAIALPNKLVYYFFKIVKDSVEYVDVNGDIKDPSEAPKEIYLPCVELCEVSAQDCPCMDGGVCTVLTTKDPLPSFVGDTLSVVVAGGSETFVKVDWKCLSEYSGSRRKNFKSENVFSLKNYPNGTYPVIKFAGGAKPKYVGVAGAFTDTLELIKYQSCDGAKTICSFLDQKLEINEKLKELILRRTASLIAGFMGMTTIGDIKLDTIDGSRVPSRR